jgi:hypothetical protein
MLRPPLCCYGVFGDVTELMHLAVTPDRQLFGSYTGQTAIWQLHRTDRQLFGNYTGRTGSYLAVTPDGQIAICETSLGYIYSPKYT